MSSRNKGRGGSSQPSNSGGKGPASKSAAPSAPTSNGNATRGGKGTNVNSTVPATQSANVVSSNPSPSTNAQSTTSSWSSLISKPNTPKTVTVDLKANLPTKQTSSSTQNNKESPANSAPNQTSTNSTSVPNNAPLNPINVSSNQKPTAEDTLPQKTTKVETESKPSAEKDKSTSNPPVKSTLTTSGSSSTPEQTKGNQPTIPPQNPLPPTTISSPNTSVTPSANLSVKAPVFKPSSINPTAPPFARTHSAPPSLEEQQKAFTGIGEQTSPQGITPPPFYIPQKTYYPSYYPPPGPAPMNFPRMYQPPLFVPSMQGPPNSQPMGVSVAPNLPNQPLVPSNFSTGGNLQQTTPTVPPGTRRSAIPIIDPKTGKEVNTADSPLPKSSSISPAVNTNPITITTPISSSTAPTQPITSTPPSSQSSQSTNNVGVQPLASNTNQSGMNAPTLQKPITTTGPGGILPELGSMNVSQSKDKGASTTSASTISSSSASTATTSSDKQPSNSTTTAVSVTPVTANSSTQETTPIIEAKPEKKKKMKEILKKAEEGTYKAASFDAYTSSEDKKTEDKKSTPAVSSQESNNPPKPTQSQKQESEEDNWETKDEKELVNLKNKQTSNDSIPSTSSVTSDSSISTVNYKKVISYPPGVWSPDNTHGKMVYDRNFMIQFQDMEFCREKPKEMADMDELMSLSADDNVPGTPKESRDKDKQWNRQSGNFGKGMKRTESNSNLSGSKGSSASNTPMSTPGTQRRDTRNGPNRRTDSKKKLRSSGSNLSTPLPPDVAPLATSENRWEPSRNKQITEEERVHRKVTSLLNKLTEETYAKLSEKLLKVEIKTVDILKDIIKIVFDKAIWEPKFVKMYAEICTQLSKVSPEFTVDEKVHNFKRLLLNRCQEEFESAFKGSKNIKDKENETQEEVAVAEDSNKTPAEKTAQDEIELRAKKQMMGNVGFIGELFKAGMLTEKIMHDCLSLLLGDIKSPSDIHIEALCRLMGSIGAEIDHQKAKKWMDQYFARMKELAKNQALPSRIRFMLEDCILMRENNWLTRREVQKEVESKAPATPVKQANIRIAPRGSLTPTNTKDSRTSKYEDDDWEVVGTKSGGKSRPPTSSKLQEDLALRPQTFGPMNSGLSRGAKGWSTKSSATPTEVSKPPKETKSSQPAPSVPEKELTVEEVETKMDDILEEYFSSNDAPEATICIKELKSPSAHASIVTKGILIGLEKREKERIAIANLFSSLFSSSLFTSDVFVKGINGVLDTLEDLSIDIPQAPSYIAFFIAHGLLAGYLSKANISTFLSILGGDSSKSSKSNDGSQFLADIIYYCSTITNESKAREVIDKNELKTSLFKSLSGKSSGDSDTFNFKFITDKKISGILPNDSIDLMFKLNHPISKIKTWVEEELGEQSLSDVKVNRGITRSILSKSFTRSLNDDKQRENFKQNAEILKPFLEQNVQQQVQTLLEIQYFISSNNLPKGTIEKVFEILQELRLVSGKAFISWEKSNDDLIPENNKNKAELVKQVESFLQRTKSSPQIDDEGEGEDGGEDDDQEDMEE